MKLAFIGTHGVGKTTLCFDLAARLKRLDWSVDIVKEVARACPLPINRETTREAQSWILHTQIAEEIAATARYQVVVCDRSVLDNYAYLVEAGGRSTALDALVGEWLATYAGLFKVPVVQAPAYDGTRDLHAGFQQAIDRRIDALLAEFGVPCHRLEPGHREGWIEATLRGAAIPLQPPQIDIFTPG